MEKVLITGVGGMDGSYLSEHLIESGYEVHGIIRRSATPNTRNIDHLINNGNIFNNNFFLHYGDVTDSLNISQLVNKIKPNRIYNLAAQSHVKISFDLPYYTAQVDALGTLNVLEAARNAVPNCKIYQASTSEIFGGQASEMPRYGFNESTPFHPRSPYGVAKLYGYWIVKNYREAYNQFGCSGILFNHSSKRRGENFLTRKVTQWCAKNYTDIISDYKTPKPLELGNIYAHRDEGHSYDYVRAMHLILDQDTPEDYVISTGETHTIKEWVEKCFNWMNLEITWEGTGVNEIGICNNKIVVVINPKYFRPSEVDFLLGDCHKAKTKLKWKPTYTFETLINEMMMYDFEENNVKL